MSEPLPKLFSQRLKIARQNAGLGQRELARITGYCESHVRKIENATNGYNSRIQTVFDLAQALNVEPEYLLGLKDIHHGTRSICLTPQGNQGESSHQPAPEAPGHDHL